MLYLFSFSLFCDCMYTNIFRFKEIIRQQLHTCFPEAFSVTTKTERPVKHSMLHLLQVFASCNLICKTQLTAVRIIIVSTNYRAFRAQFRDTKKDSIKSTHPTTLGCAHLPLGHAHSRNLVTPTHHISNVPTLF